MAADHTGAVVGRNPRTHARGRLLPRAAGRVAELLAPWGAAAYLDFLFMTRSPRQLLGYAVSDALLAVASAAGTLLLAARFEGIGSWTRDQVIFMLGYAI